MPMGRLQIMQISKEKTKGYPKATFVLFALKIILLRLRTMSDDGHSESVFYYPDELEFQGKNEATSVSLKR